MTDDPILVLERQLVTAATHRLQPPAAATTARGSRAPRGAAALLVAAAVLIPVLAVAGALALTGRRSRSQGSTAASHGLTLRSELAALRRAQRPSDLAIGVSSTSLATVDRALLRRIPATFSGGTRANVDLVVSRRNRPGARQRLMASVAMSSPGRGLMTFTGPATAQQFAARGLVITLSGSEVAVVVPDGVAEVRIAAAGVTLATARVRDNVAAVTLAQLPAHLDTTHALMRWYSSSGRLIRQTSAQLASTAQPVLNADGNALPPILGVLRRPQTPADRSLPALTDPSAFDMGLGSPQDKLARLATTTPWKTKVYLVPFITPTGPDPVLDVFGRGGGAPGGGVLGGFSRADIETGQAVMARRGVRSQDATRFIIVVPDGVSQVTLRASGKRLGGAPVHGNVAALAVRDGAARPLLTMQWLGAGGRVIGTFPLRSGTG